jgi:hypothetical protein
MLNRKENKGGLSQGNGLPPQMETAWGNILEKMSELRVFKAGPISAIFCQGPGTKAFPAGSRESQKNILTFRSLCVNIEERPGSSLHNPV